MESVLLKGAQTDLIPPRGPLEGGQCRDEVNKKTFQAGGPILRFIDIETDTLPVLGLAALVHQKR